MMHCIKIAKNTFEIYLKQTRPIWQSYWEKLFNQQNGCVWGEKAIDQYHRMIDSGKCMRSCLVILAYRLAGNTVDSRVLLAALSVEILHNAFLIHDDIVDKSDLRRNQPTAHKHFEKDALNTGVKRELSAETGIAMALNVGDLGQVLAQKILLESGFPTQQLLKCIEIFNEHLWKTVMGQMYDIDPSSVADIDEAYIEKIQLSKTAYYSFVLPLLVGHTLGQGEQSNVKHLISYGLKVGTIYQMQDDILGIFGEDQTLGKPTNIDIKAGKKTLLICIALANALSSERAELLELYGHPGVEDQQLERIKTIIKKTGALDYSLAKTKRLMAGTVPHIDKIALNREDKDILHGITWLAGHRVY